MVQIGKRSSALETIGVLLSLRHVLHKHGEDGEQEVLLHALHHVEELSVVATNGTHALAHWK